LSYLSPAGASIFPAKKKEKNAKFNSNSIQFNEMEKIKTEYPPAVTPPVRQCVLVAVLL